MGQLSAEARGQVRLAIETIYKKYPTPLRLEIKNHTDRMCDRTFKKNKRLSINDMSYFFCLDTIRDIPIYYNQNFEQPCYLYAEPTIKSLHNEEKNFEDLFLELREIAININKRKIRFFDIPKNIHISGHFMGRIFERGSVKDEITNQIILEIMKSMHYIDAIKNQNNLINVAFPFLNGLALGELVDESLILNREIKREWDYHGVSNYENNMDLSGSPDCVLRLTTFLDEDLLDFQQDKIFQKMKNLFSDPKLKENIGILIKPKFMNAEINEEVLNSKEILNVFFNSDEWKMVCG